MAAVSAKWDGRSRAIFACPLVVEKSHRGNVLEVQLRLAGRKKCETFFPFRCLHQSRDGAVHDLCAQRTRHPEANQEATGDVLDPMPPCDSDEHGVERKPDARTCPTRCA